ncbi:MAG: hypothetical protein R6U41_07880 [Desulfosalsimonas sp.]|uniref:hypothetical protein n=1 Tax=Desulfosalsimonas sp. TaxID=3073848 RepID=UPI0039709C8F
MPAALIVYFLFFEPEAMYGKIVALLFFRSVMIGLITASLSFFIVESYTRHISIPLVFPDGGLTEVPGTSPTARPWKAAASWGQPVIRWNWPFWSRSRHIPTAHGLAAAVPRRGWPVFAGSVRHPGS